MYLSSMERLARRLFIGDLHGCLEELEDLLQAFSFLPGTDALYSVGDVVGKGPHSLDTLKRLRELNTITVRGNHDHAMLIYDSRPLRSLKPGQRKYLEDLGSEKDFWLSEIRHWPLYLKMDSIILVHAGLEPGIKALKKMRPRILMNIRTWDPASGSIEKESAPPWYSFITLDKTVIFGHWARAGRIELPGFKGLDTGCVYGGRLTGYCPEEDRFYSVKSRQAYSPVESD